MRAKGEGSITKRKDGRWEARITVGYDPGTGKPIRKSFYGKTQREVKDKMQAAQSQVTSGDWLEPSRATVEDWMRIWAEDYTGHLKPRTAIMYKGYINNHIIPGLGKAPLQKLQPHDVQKFYNKLSIDLAPKSVKNIHGILHKALKQAVANGMMRTNPADFCTLPKAKKPEIKPLGEEEMKAFIRKSLEKTDTSRLVFAVDTLTGMRQSEILGLTWDNVDLDNGLIYVKQQLQLVGGKYVLLTPKHDKERVISISPYVVKLLQGQIREQKKWQLAAGSAWDNTNNFVFTDELGDNLKRHTIYKRFKKIAAEIGCPDARFHDLRHTYAVFSLRAGDDIKTLQDNLGHHTAAFTLDVYGHVTEEMKKASADRQQALVEKLGL